MRCRPSTASSCIGDDELNRFLRQRYFPKLAEAAWRRQCDVARPFPDFLRQQGAMPVMELVGEKGERYRAIGNAPMRRSVPASDATIPAIAAEVRSTSTAALKPMASGSASR